MNLGVLFFAQTLAVVAFAAPAVLSQTGLYDDIAQKKVASSAMSYSPQYPLWSDGARKSRWLWLPAGTQIDGADPDQWVFPKGTKVWKEFSFGDHRVETRLMEKLPNGKWEFSTYLWNAEETEATLAPTTGVKNYYPITSEVKHDIPSRLDCLRCHKRGGDAILGLDPLQLSTNRDPLAPHAEAIPENGLTLKTLVEKNLLINTDGNVAPKIHATTPEGRAAMGYVHSNCGTCHNPDGSEIASGMSLRYPGKPIDQKDSSIVQTAVGKVGTTFAIPGEETSLRIKPGDPEHSSFVYRMKTVTPNHRMPVIASKVLDLDAIELLTKWIDQL